MGKEKKQKGYVIVDNDILDVLIASELTPTEFACVFFLIRKTKGYNKASDYIPYSQISKGTGRSKSSVVRAMKALKDAGIIVLVEQGSFPYNINRWKIESDITKWGRRGVSKMTQGGSVRNDTSIVANFDTSIGVKNDTIKTQNTKHREKQEFFSAQPQSQQLDSGSQANSFLDEPGIPLDKLNFGSFTLPKDEI